MLFAAFLAVFAFDVFDEGFGLGETVIALLLHLLPSALVVILLAVAWRWEPIGALFFGLAALAMLVVSRGEAWVISGPSLLVGLLFWASWKTRARSAPR
jgi:hypothetical protein